ncbi:putative ribonuclease H-like domain-containing protein [Tanacetum coccineum]
MALPNEHQLTFSQYTDARTMFAIIKTRFGGVVIAQEDLNSKLLSSLPPEWNTHVVVWMNKAEIETMSIDDLYNNFKIVKQNVKKICSTASFSDNVVYAFMIDNPNGSNLLQQDLEKIHEDDLEAMDLKWQLSLLSMRAKRFLTGVIWQREQVLANCKELLITYRKNEVLFSEEVAVLKREVACKDYEINVLKSEFEKVKQEKEGIEFKIEKFDKASKDLDKLLGSQITDKSKKGLGYSAVPPPHPLIYNRPKKLDLSYSGLDEFKEPEFKAYGSEVSEQESNVVCDKKSDDSKENSDDSLIKEQVSKDTSSFVESSLNVDKETVFPVDKKVEFVKPKNHEKPVKKSVRYAEMYRSQTPRGNQRNWNGQKSNQLGRDFVMYNKACFICGSFDHVQINCNHHQRKRIVSRNNYNRVDYDYYAKTTHPSVHKNMTPRAILLKTSLTPLNTVMPVKSMSYFSKQAQSTSQRPFYKQTTLTRRYVHTAMRHYHTERPRAGNTARSYTEPTVRPKVVNTARPYTTLVNAVRAKRGKPQIDDKGFVDSGCSRHMTGNIAYLSHFKEFDGGYVTFGGGTHGGRISSKGTLKTDFLDFEDLPDESQILLKIPRKDNMYSFDMKNIVPKENLTCLVAKATLDESMLCIGGLGSNTEPLVSPRFTWVFFLATKDETNEILKNCIKEIENLVDKKVKIIRFDNGTEFKNNVMDDFCREKADFKLPTTFWAEAVSTACYVQNKVLVVKPHNKTSYELFRGRVPGQDVSWRHVKRGWDTKIPQSSGPPIKVGDEAVHKELGDRMEKAATTASSLEAEQDSGNINRTQSMATLNELNP